MKALSPMMDARAGAAGSAGNRTADKALGMGSDITITRELENRLEL